MPSTVYDVKTRYLLDVHGADELRNLGGTADRVWGTLKKLGTVAIGAIGFGMAKKGLVDFNRDIENARVNIAAIARMFGQEGSWGGAMDYATGLFDRYQQAAKVSTATTKEFLDMHLSLAPTFAKYHVAAKAIEEIVQGATVTAPILGEKPETFAMDVKQMLQGTVTLRDRSAVSLLSMLGIDRETFNQKTKQDVQYAIDVVHKALNNPAIMEARKAQESSFAGVTSTLVDSLEIAFGKVGLPLVKEITKEVQRWNDWMTANESTVNRWINTLGQGLKTAFGFVKDVVTYLVDHQDLVKVVIAGLATSKIAGMTPKMGNGGVTTIGAMGLGVGAGALAGYYAGKTGTGDAVDYLSRATFTVAGAFSALPGPIGETARAATALGTVLGQLAATYIDHRADQAVERGSFDQFKQNYSVAKQRTAMEEEIRGLAPMLPEGALNRAAYVPSSASEVDMLNRAQTAQRMLDSVNMALVQAAKNAHAVTEGGDFNPTGFRQYLDRMGESADDAAEETERVARAFRDLGDRLKKPKDESKPIKPPPTTQNVTIQNVEVAAKDPDRFMYRLSTKLRRVWRNPTASRWAITGDF